MSTNFRTSLYTFSVVLQSETHPFKRLVHQGSERLVALQFASKLHLCHFVGMLIDSTKYMI